jgi:hypothetical protein
MRQLIVAASAALFAGGAGAAPGVATPATTTQCVEVSGRAIPATCTTPASRLDKREYICICPAGGQRVTVPVCGEGESPPPESARLNVVRREASRDGALVGDTFEGHQICVAKGDR